MENEIIKFNIIIINKESNKIENNISLENMKFLLNKSILRIFGSFVASKLIFEIKKLSENNEFQIQLFKFQKLKLITSLLMISDLEFNKTIFGQVYQSFGKTKGEDFLIQKGRRLFIVCLKNEYASDSGGPYHEVISGICQELQSDYLNMFSIFQINLQISRKSVKKYQNNHQIHYQCH